MGLERGSYLDATGRRRLYRITKSALVGRFECTDVHSASGTARITTPSMMLRMRYRFSMRASKGGTPVFMENLPATCVFTPRPETWEPSSDVFTQGPPLVPFSDGLQKDFPAINEAATKIKDLNGYPRVYDSEAVRFEYTLTHPETPIEGIPTPSQMWLIVAWELEAPSTTPPEMADELFARCEVEAGRPVIVGPCCEPGITLSTTEPNPKYELPGPPPG